MSTQFAFTDRKTLAIMSVGFLFTLPGCSPKTEIVLHQPFAPPSQQQLELASNWAYEASADDRRIWLLAFPLPSTPEGPRDFHLYLSTPDELDNFTVDETGSAVRGFLIQEVGHLRGKTVVTGGQVRVSRPWFDWRKHTLELNLACADGTVIIGHASPDSLASEISAFERRYSGDVLALTPQEDTRDLAADGVPDRTTATP